MTWLTNIGQTSQAYLEGLILGTPKEVIARYAQTAIRAGLLVGRTVVEESHMGVHWAYSKALGDTGFLDAYNRFEAALPVPDAYIRLSISPALSASRQRARATADVQVDAGLIADMERWLDVWHRGRARARLVVIDADRSAELVVSDLLAAIGLHSGRGHP